MSEVTKYDAQKKKLEGLCEEHDFTFRIRKETYPITLTIRPIQGVEEQLDMLADADGKDYISPNASLTWSFADNEVTSKVEGGTFTMPKTLESKFVNIFKKMVSFWQQYFFRFLIENELLTKLNMPVIDEDDADDEDEPDAEDDADDPDPSESVDDLDEDDDQESGEDASTDDLIAAATQLVRMENKASMQLLARRLKIGYARAGRIMTALKDSGIVSFDEAVGRWEVLPHDVPAEG